MNKPLVYIAGPYTHPDPVSNTRRAVDVFNTLLDTGLIAPLCPHLSILLDFARPRPVEEWYAYDLHVLRRCDAVYQMSGTSSGADKEVAFAEHLGIPVFDDFHTRNLVVWAKRWITDHGGTLPPEPCVHVAGESE